MQGSRPGPGWPAPELRAAVAERVRVERARQRLTQEELAHRSGLSRVYIGAVERGEVNCSVAVLAQIAAALGLPPRELLP